MSDKDTIIELFNDKVRGKRPETAGFNQRHDGKGGHWLEAQMGVYANNSNSPDLLGYEMKNDVYYTSSSKISLKNFDTLSSQSIEAKGSFLKR